ncbi:unnamed protein product [Orchesella dallaii]|uniref:Ribosome biogenesis protein NOP53 n=1 Tax=Orchesella dallaii TaxID=48710 RepID=A0ABP1QTD8_9HEXA
MGKSKVQRFSKGKSKKDTWKKLQHPDLDDFLVEQREDERLGVKAKTDDELFVLDQQGSESFFKAANSQQRVIRQAKKSKDGPLVDFDSLRCNQILKPDSAVKDPVIKRNRTRLPSEKKHVDMKLKDEIRRYKQGQQAKAQAADSTTDDGPTDPWSAPNAKSVESILSDEWLTDEAKRNLLHNRSLHKVKKPTTELKAVEPPHPGLSVNPSFADHQAILKETIELTKAEITKEQKLIRATSTPKWVKDDDEETDVKEEIDVKSEPESDDDDTKAGILKPKPKTRSQKRKARELNEQQRALQEKKTKLKQEAEVFRIKSLRKEIVETEKETKEKLKKKIDRKIKHARFEQLVLSKHKYKPLKPDPLLSDEMAGTFLGDAKNSIADLTLERFKSLQKRNLIEPTVKQRMKRKYKLKKYIRPSEKMEWEKTGMWNGEKLLNPGDRQKSRRGPRRN